MAPKRTLPLLGLVTWLIPACAVTPTPTSEAEALAQTAQRAQALVADGETPGIQHMVVSDSETLSAVHYGHRDSGSQQPVEPSTAFMAYSVTKVVTAIVVLMLAEEGKMSLDAPLSDYVEAHPYGDHVTIRSLLNHTSGVPNPIPTSWFFTEDEEVDRDEALKRILLKHPDLDFEPGDDYGYSNIGYWLLEQAIEATTGSTYAQTIKERIFDPLAIQTTDASFELPEPNRLATGHSPKFGMTNAVFYMMSPSRYWIEARNGWSRFARLQHFGVGYGGLYCSSAAIGAILRDLLREEPVLLRAQTRDLLFTKEPVEGTLGGWVIGELNGATYFGKQGGGFGFQSNMRVYPELNLGTVFMANTTAASAGPIDGKSNRLDAPFVALRQASRRSGAE